MSADSKYTALVIQRQQLKTFDFRFLRVLDWPLSSLMIWPTSTSRVQTQSRKPKELHLNH